jgi:hypothetical protein
MPAQSGNYSRCDEKLFPLTIQPEKSPVADHSHPLEGAL